MYRTSVIVLPLLLLGLCVSPGAAQDTTRRGVTIGLTYDPGIKPGIVVLPIGGPHGDSVAAILQRDLDYSDRFTVVAVDSSDPAAFRATGAAGGLNYSLFTKLGALAVVQVTSIPAGFHVALHDVSKGAVVDVSEHTVSAPPLSRDWRMAIHGMSDEIEFWIRGERGIAQTRIAFTSGRNTIHIVDSDGACEIEVPGSGSAMSPAWNTAGTMLTYSTWGLDSRIVVHDLTTGSSRKLNATPMNTNMTPVFSPDGGSVVYAHAGENGSDIFSVSLTTGEVRRVSAGRGSDNTSPSFSPDGRRIAFTSGRVGHPEIYIMDADGSNPELLTSFDFGDQNYRSDPDWSPDNRLIAFQSRFSDRFQVMTISLKDGSTKLLTSEGENDQPSWAPDGRHIVFTSTRSGTRQLWIMDTESSRMRQLTHGEGSRLAAWSGRLVGRAP